MKLYTRKGDKGKTSILGREKIPKDHVRIEAYGTVDELNSQIGVIIHHVEERFHDELRKIQSLLFEIGSELASAETRDKLNQSDVEHLEQLIDEAVEQTPELKSFVLPGGALGASYFHQARTLTRRTERKIVAFSKQSEFSPHVIPWINRLSDLFFAWARLSNHINNIDDIKWEARK